MCQQRLYTLVSDGGGGTGGAVCVGGGGEIEDTLSIS
eukprot:COSAG06_NODE_67142_length_252_cov_1.470588_1_plen_36_part_01